MRSWVVIGFLTVVAVFSVIFIAVDGLGRRISATDREITQAKNENKRLAVLIDDMEVDHENNVKNILALMDGKSEKIAILEESVSPENTRWAKIKRVRNAVKKSVEELSYPDKLGSIGRTTYSAAVVDYSEKFDVPIPVILAMTRRESAFNPRAVSHAGARGLIQIMPSTAREIAGDLGIRHYSMFKIRDNVKFGVYYLMKMLDQFDGDTALAVRAYNCGPTYVQKVLGGEYRDYPSETREYVRVIVESESSYINYYENMGL